MGIAPASILPVLTGAVSPCPWWLLGAKSGGGLEQIVAMYTSIHVVHSKEGSIYEFGKHFTLVLFVLIYKDCLL
jgi:hypothetical protein